MRVQIRLALCKHVARRQGRQVCSVALRARVVSCLPGESVLRPYVAARSMLENPPQETFEAVCQNVITAADLASEPHRKRIEATYFSGEKIVSNLLLRLQDDRVVEQLAEPPRPALKDLNKSPVQLDRHDPHEDAC
jgi:hypothetical protein